MRHPWRSFLLLQVRLSVNANELSVLSVLIDKKTRDKTTKKLAIFLSSPSRNGLTHAEMAKLWKGIFYCAYDPQPVAG